MELRQLVYFEAVVRCGGFTRAAQALHVAQPAISAQVRNLERELGVSLLTRTTRRIVLTAAGELVLARARRVLGELDGVRADVQELSAVARGQVNIAATDVCGTLDLPAALAAFHTRYPGITVSLRAGLVDSLLAALDAGEVDVVVAPAHADLAARYTAHVLAQEELVVATAVGHHLARQPSCGVAALREETLVCLPQGSGLRAIVEAAAAAEGFEPRIGFEATSPYRMRELVSAGLGVAVIARSVAEAPGTPVAVLELVPALEHPPIAVIRHHDRRLTPAARAFHRHLVTTASASTRTSTAARRGTPQPAVP